MKTLRDFWHWYRNEKPRDKWRARELREENLSPLAKRALSLAAVQIADRARPSGMTPEELEAPLEALSLAFGQALADMYEAVPGPEPELTFSSLGLR